MKTTRLLAILLAFTATACGPFHMGSRERATVIFSNESIDQADVYAVMSSGESVRLGTVLGVRTDTLTVPSSVTDHIGTTSIVARILAHPYQPSTGAMTLRATDVIRVRLTADGRNLFVTPG